MNVVVFGPVFVNVMIHVDGVFDEMGSNKGTVETSYSSEAVEIAIKLAKNNDVTFVSSLDTQADVYIRRKLKTHNINTEYIAYEQGGLGFKIQFDDPEDRVAEIMHYPSMKNVTRDLEIHEDEIFGNADAVIIYEIDPQIVELCKKHRVSIYRIPNEVYEDRMDDDDLLLIKDIPLIRPDTCEGILE